MGLIGRVRRRLNYEAFRFVTRGPLAYWIEGWALSALLRRTSDLDLASRVLQTKRFRRAVRPTFVSVPDGSRIMILAPHQDDAIIGAGGVLQRCVDLGKDVQCLYVTDGATGWRNHTPSEVVAIRRKEAERAWARVGAREPRFLDLPCGDIRLTDENVSALARHIRDFDPDTLFVPFLLEDPNDHRKTNHLLWLATEREGLHGMEIWGYQITTMVCPNVGVDITDVIERKDEVMQLWVSQNTIFDYAHQSRGMAAANTLFYKGTHALEVPPRYVELFFVTPIEEWRSLAEHYYGSGTPAEIYGEASASAPVAAEATADV